MVVLESRKSAIVKMVWRRLFKRAKMTRKEINEAILQDYVNKICLRSRIAADTVKVYLADTEKTETSKYELGAIAYAEVLLEFTTFFLHFTDRCLFWEVIADGSAGVELRDNLMDQLAERCINSAVDFCWFGLKEYAKQEYKKSSFKVYNNRMEEYSKYKKSFAEKNEGAKGTLFWEFAKNICRIVKKQHHIGLIHLCITVAIDALADINPKSLAKAL